MKKIITLCAIALLSAVSLVFAQTADPLNPSSVEDRMTRDIQVEDKYPELHPSSKNVNIQLEYTPLSGEVRLYYTCLSSSFDQGEAMNTAMAVLQDFMVENGYKHYYYKAKDKVKYYRDSDTRLRMARYNSYVQFTK